MKEGAYVKAPVKAKLFKHQIEAYKLGIRLKGTALLMDPGTGKTLSAEAVMGYRYLKKQVKKVLIICPKSVIPVWAGRKNEFIKFADYPFTVSTLAGRKKAFPTGRGLQIAVITYESTWRMIRELMKWKPDMVILDESHKIKNNRAKHSKAIHKIGRITKYRMILTGTLVSESPMDAFSQYQFLDESIFGSNFFKHRNKYAVMGGFMGKQIKRYKNLKTFSQKLHSIAYRVTRKECLDLPSVTSTSLYCQLTGKALKYYKEMKKEFVIELGKDQYIQAPLVISQMAKLQQIAGGFVNDEDKNVIPLGRDKLKLVEELLPSVKDQKIVIFAKYLPEVKALDALAQKLGFKTDTLTGKVKDRDAVIEKLQTGKTQVLVVQIKTGGVGITLTAANIAIFYSTTFSSLDYEQAKARLERIGQTKKMLFIHLVAEDTIDEEIYEALTEKKNLAELVIDKYRPQKGKKNMKKGKFVDENPVIEAKLEELKKAIEAGEVMDLSKIKPERLPSSNSLEQKGIAQLTIIQGGKIMAKIGEVKEGKKDKKGDKKKESTPRIEGPVITIKDLADELGIEATELRKKLRGSDLEKPSGRWEWSPDHKDLGVIRKWKI